MATSGHKEPSTSRKLLNLLRSFVEVAERFVYLGMSGNLVTYLTNELHEPIPMATKNVNTWVGVSYLLTVIGAFIADAYLGRFKTILVSSIIYCFATVVLNITVSVIPLHYQKAMFFVALYILSIGLAGHRPCAQTFAVDQFCEDSPEEKKAKNNVGWAAGFGILTGAMVVALALFLFGYKKFRRQGPLGSPFTTVAQVFVAATRKRHLDGTLAGFGVYRDDKSHETNGTLAHTSQFRCLDKAMIIDDHDASSTTRNPWRLRSQTQVEQVNLILRLIPVWTCCLMFGLVQSFVQTFFTKQGSTMVRSIGSNFKLPQASLQIFVFLTVIVVIPIYDRVFVPTARKITGILLALPSYNESALTYFYP
ncbi:hypothetical protein ACFX2C_028460 [Malus domestica]